MTEQELLRIIRNEIRIHHNIGLAGTFTGLGLGYMYYLYLENNRKK